MSLEAWYHESMMKLDDFMTTREAAEELGITAAAVRHHILCENIDALKVGTIWLIPVKELEKIRDAKPGRPPKKSS